MNPIWILVGGAAVLYFLRTGGLAGFTFGAGDSATDAEVYGPQPVARLKGPIVMPRQGVVLAPTAASPGDAPDFHNPNVAGPQLAPVSNVPIVPAHVDVSYAPAPYLSAGSLLFANASAPSMGDVTSEAPYAAPSDVVRAGFTNPAPPQLYIPASPTPIAVVDASAAAPEPVIDYAGGNDVRQQEAFL